MPHRNVVVVGGGTAGLLAAIALVRSPAVKRVTVIRSSALGHIMIGEGTFAKTPELLHGDLGIPRRAFYDAVNPTLKLGLRLIWGPRPYFDFPFTEEFDSQVLPKPGKPWGYYHLDDGDGPTILAGRDAPPAVRAGYHIENHNFVNFLEEHFVGIGGDLLDTVVTSVQVGERGVESLMLDSGDTVMADAYVDASGFRGELIHKALGEPYRSLRSHLFCDRAVVGGWARDGERILPFTTAETMDSGWAWQIEHEHRVNRGYVFSSAFLTDDEAADELRRKNPKIEEGRLRVVPFESRHVDRAWVRNVVAIGNACGFVEPLEATNIQVICMHALAIAEAFAQDEPSPDAYNERALAVWHDIRDFLALHYRFNTRLDTPFWEHARRETPLGDLEQYVEEYQSRGPTLISRPQSLFGHDGPLALLLGMRVPWRDCAIA